MAPSITLYLSNGQATIWDASGALVRDPETVAILIAACPVAATLQTVHRILGVRTGTLPGVGQQNAFLGLPVTLMEEEVAYLVGKGVLTVVFGYAS